MADRLLTEIFLTILNLSISAGWLILAVLLIKLLFRRAPAAFSLLLWGVVAVRLLFPVSVESIFSLLPSGETVRTEILYEAEPKIHSGIAFLNAAVNPVLSDSMAPAPGASVNPLQVYGYIAAVLWLLGMTGMLLYMAGSYWILARRVKGAIPQGEGIYRAEGIDTPFVLGFFRPRIYIPTFVEEGELPYIIAHEQAHIKRRDHLIKPIGFVLLSVYWFQPLVWVSYLFLSRDIEIACDARVIRDMDREGRALYSEALLSAGRSPVRVSACPLAFGEVGVKARVKHVLSYKKPTFWVILTAALLVTAVAVGYLTTPKDPALPGVFARSYGVKEVVYSVTDYTVSDITPSESVPYYSITVDGMLMEKTEGDYNTDWRVIGALQAFALKKGNFDSYFTEEDSFQGDASAARLRKGNKQAFRVEREGEAFTYLLLQDDGSVYLALGFRKRVSTVYLLGEDLYDDSGYIVTNGVQVIPLILVDTDAPLSEILNLPLHYILLDPEAENSVPFQILLGGKEQYGRYHVYDAETLQPLDFIRPSGLLPQTYLFQNAEIGGQYLVTVDFGENKGCFIACIGDPKFSLLDTESYVFLASEEILKPSISLHEDGTFSMTFSAISSYIGFGKYERKDGRLIARTGDGKFTYTFHDRGGALVFDGENSSASVWFSDITDGSRFIKVAKAQIAAEE